MYQTLIVLWGLLSLTASAGSNPLKAIAGTYFVLEWNGVTQIGGTMQIVASDSELGVLSLPLKMASRPIASLHLTSPAASTQVSTNGSSIKQHFVSLPRTLDIDYTVADQQIQIQARYCPHDGACDENTFLLMAGKAPGQPVDPKAFFSSLLPTYKIQVAGGQTPKPEVAEMQVDLEDLSNGAVLHPPYCRPPGGCDTGYLPMPYDKTKIFKRTLSPTQALYTILVEQNAKLGYYTWEEDGNQRVLRNYQYLYENEVLCLEHRMTP